MNEEFGSLLSLCFFFFIAPSMHLIGLSQLSAVVGLSDLWFCVHRSLFKTSQDLFWVFSIMKMLLHGFDKCPFFQFCPHQAI